MTGPAESFALALSLHRAGRLDQAAVQYRKTLEAAPGNAGALFNLAALLARTEAYDEAEVLYARVIDLDPTDAAAHSNLGNLMHAQGRLDEAMACYEKSIEIDPDLLEAHLNLGNLYRTRDLNEEAVACYTRALEIDPGHAAVHANLGATLVAAGETESAEKALRIAVALAPDNVEALNNLGGLLYGRDDFEGAAERYREAIEIEPDQARLHCNLGTVLGKLGSSGANASYRRALELKPDYVEAMRKLAIRLLDEKELEEAEELLTKCVTLRAATSDDEFQFGNLFLAKGQPESAIAHYEAAIAIDDRPTEVYNNLGNALQGANRHDDAIKVFRKALEIDPKSAQALNNLANSHMAQQRVDDAIASYHEAIEADPELDVAYVNLGNAYRTANRLEESLQWFEEAVKVNPSLPSAYNGIGLAHQCYNRHEEAIAAFKKAIEIEPHYSQGLNNPAISYQDCGRPVEAIRAYQEVLDHHPELTEVYFNLGTLLQLMNRYDESVVAFQEALTKRPNYDSVYPYLAHGLMQQCSWTNLGAVVAHVLDHAQIEAERGEGITVSAFGLQSLPASMELRLETARQISRRAAEKIADIQSSMAPFQYDRTRRDKIKVGFISPDFRFHSVAVAFKGVLAARDRERFEYCAYAINTYGEDDMSNYFRKEFDRYVDITDMEYSEAAQRINDGGTNILVDLAGHTRGGRYEVLAFQPAPIQAHWLGFSSTIGADYIQYLVTDPIQIPPEDAKYCSESLVYLPDTFMATSRPDVLAMAVSREECELPENAFVFANFNSHYKFYPDLFDIWMRLLRRLPDSVLWMLGGTETSRKNLQAEAEKRGVDSKRLVFAKTVIHPYHLARLRNADLCLDNLYHGGGVTTTDALWMGVPVLTLWGASPPARNGATLVSAIGAPELTVYSMAEYERTASDLAAHPEKLAALKAKLKANRDTAPLFDVKRLTAHLELGFEMMWQNYLDGNEPRTIDVPALPVSHVG